MVLGLDFIFFSSILILILLPLYIYRKKVFKFLYDNDNLELFLKDFQNYCKIIFPKIKLDLTRIDINDKTIKPEVQKMLAIEYVLNQYIDYTYIKRTQVNINRDLLWGSYELDSIPKKSSTPADLTKRKELVISRDKEKCNRCGKNIKSNSSMLLLIKPVKNGGTYHFENLTVVCTDCYKIINSKNPSKILKDLTIYDTLVKKYIK